MARNGAGTYSLPAGNPVTTGTTISSTWANNTLSDIGTSLTASIAYDGQTIPVANLPMGNYIHTGVGNATARTNYAVAGQVQDGVYTTLTSASGTDTIIATGPIGLSAYVAGQTFNFVAAGANTTTSVTLNINGIGAKNITKNGSTALAIGDIASGAMISVIYDGTQFQLQTGVSGVTTFSGGTTGLTPATATKGAITLAGTLATANGGTNLTSFTSGGAVYATSTSALTTGTLPVASGGTGVATLTSGAVVIGAGTSAVTSVSPTTAGNCLFTSDGTNWSSAAKLFRGTAVASTSGTSIDFTSIPSWVKRITVMLSGMSTSGNSIPMVQIGAGSIVATGYTSVASGGGATFGTSSNTTGFIIKNDNTGTYFFYGSYVLFNITGNTWVFSGQSTMSGATPQMAFGNGGLALSGTLDRVRITTVNGTDTFDAGSINIMYE